MLVDVLTVDSTFLKFVRDYGKVIVRYGWIIYVAYFGIILIFLMTFFQSSGEFLKHQKDYHITEEIKSPITITASGGFISADISNPDIDGPHLVTSHSSVNVDAIVTNKDNNVIQTISDIPPEGSFWVTPDAHLISIYAG
ncbi:MAG: hypothetical protein ABR958_07640 [Dehalococcoidales bacterium]